jgi:hypothetical protein
VENVVVYIAGFVVQKLCDKVSCTECKSTLVATSLISDELNVHGEGYTALLNQQTRGDLLMPSADVVGVCKVCELSFRTLISSSGGQAPDWENGKSEAG